MRNLEVFIKDIYECYLAQLTRLECLASVLHNFSFFFFTHKRVLGCNKISFDGIRQNHLKTKSMENIFEKMETEIVLLSKEKKTHQSGFFKIFYSEYIHHSRPFACHNNCGTICQFESHLKSIPSSEFLRDLKAERFLPNKHCDKTQRN